jgi:cytochrome P450
LPGFSDRALREQKHYLQAYAAKLVSQLRRSSGEQDLARWYGLTTFDIISALAFGEPGSCLNNADQPWMNVIGNRAKQIVWYYVFTYYGVDSFIEWLLSKYTIIPRQQHMKMCCAKIMKRLRKTEKTADFMSYIVGNKTEKLSNLDLVIMASAFIVAGSGTTASALTGTTFFLLRNPAAYKRLVDEIRSTLLKMTTSRCLRQMSCHIYVPALKKDFECFRLVLPRFLTSCPSKENILMENLSREG